MKSFLRIILVSIVASAFVFFVFYDLVVETLGKQLTERLEGRVEEKAEQPISNVKSTAVRSTFTAQKGVNVSFVKAAEATVNSVVHVKSISVRSSSRSRDPFWNFFWGGNGYGRQQQSQPVEGFGSGVIITQDGFIVTNNHVVESADRVEVTLNNKKRYTAKIVGRDASTDIALLKIEANNLPAIVFGDSKSLKIGEWVLAVGNPFNLTSTVTSGIISAKSRDVDLLGRQGLEAFIQTDAAVNPGNSGGALVNLSGELIGICTAISTKTGSFSGYSFAVPSNIAKKVVEDLLEYGQIQRAYLGIHTLDLDAETVEYYGIPVKDFEGVYVKDVLSGSGAQVSGIEQGDVIVKVDDVTIRKQADLIGYLGTKRPGDRVEVTVVRSEEGDEVFCGVEKRPGYHKKDNGRSYRCSFRFRSYLNTFKY